MEKNLEEECPVCFYINGLFECVYLNCCNKYIHRECLIKWNNCNNSNKCLYCTTNNKFFFDNNIDLSYNNETIINNINKNKLNIIKNQFYKSIKFFNFKKYK